MKYKDFKLSPSEFLVKLPEMVGNAINLRFYNRNYVFESIHTLVCGSVAFTMAFLRRMYFYSYGE